MIREKALADTDGQLLDLASAIRDYMASLEAHAFVGSPESAAVVSDKRRRLERVAGEIADGA